MANVKINVTAVENLPSAGVINFIPKEFLGKPYVRLMKDTEVKIKKIIMDEYNVLNEDGEEMLRKDGTNVTNTIYYIGLEDGSYTTVKNTKVDVQIRLLMAGNPEYVKDNVMDFGDDFLTVKTKEVMIKYGNGKDYPGIVFE